MEIADLEDILLAQTRSSDSSGWIYRIVRAEDPEKGSYGYIEDNAATFVDQTSYPGQPIAIRISRLNEDVNILSGDYLTVTFGEGTEINVYPPLLNGAIDTYYYIGVDGCTYLDRWLCEPAGVIPTPNPTSSVTPTRSATPSPSTTPSPPPPSPPTPSATLMPPIIPTPTIIKYFRVVGRVVNKDTGLVIPGAAVRIVCPDQQSGVGKTNGTGEYNLLISTHFRDGTARAQARCRGYLPGSAEAQYIDWADEKIVDMGDVELKAKSVYSCGIVSGDYDGDGVSDIAVFRPDSGLWAIRGVSRLYFGGEGDELTSADYNGDGTVDVSIFRATSGLWAIRGVSRIYYGSFEDIPVPGDYDGDGTSVIGIFRGVSGLWSVRSITRTYFGTRYDQPVPGDYDGDGSRDQAVFRSSSGLWAMRGISRFYLGANGDRLVAGDYDGLGSQAAGIFRDSSGLWAIRGVTRIYFGAIGDQPVPGDYSGSGVDYIGIFRGDSGLWAIRGVTRAYYGGATDIPATR